MSTVSEHNNEAKSLSKWQLLGISLLVPGLFFLLLEVICYAFSLDEKLSPMANSLQLEMPTWMSRDPNTVMRAAKVVGNKDSVDWLSMFEEGNGYRVRLIPNIERSITNTFSQIAWDKAHKYFVKANSLGFRGPELTKEKPKDTLRILVFGDSSSFGWGVNQHETFSALLPTLLKERISYASVEVGNFAIPGDSSEYGRLIFEKFANQYQFDYLVLGFGANDAKKTTVPHTTQVRAFQEQGFLQSIRSIAQFSAIFRTLESLMLRIKVKNLQKDPNQKKSSAVGRKRYLENLSAMAESAKQNGARATLILNLCTPSDYAKKARELAEQQNFLYLNGQAQLLEDLPDIIAGKIEPEIVNEMKQNYPNDLKNNSLFYITSDSCHPNKLGHAVIAKDLTEIIALNANKS